MRKISKYIVRTTDSFSGLGMDVFDKEFDNFDEAVTYYKKEIETCAYWKDNTPTVELIDGIAVAEKELANLKMAITELELAIKIAKEN